MNILILFKKSDECIQHLQNVCGFLNNKKYCIYIEPYYYDDEYFQKCSNESIQFVNTINKYSGQNIEYVLALGGDGTVLDSHRYANSKNATIIPIALGTKNFLSEFEINEFYECFDEIVSNNYNIQNRLTLKTNKLPNKSALNEITVKHMIDQVCTFELYINGKRSEDIVADGIIIATPTGSTAYASSAGGPHVDSDMDAIIIVPICPVKLKCRPLVIKGNSKILIKHPKNVRVALDGIRDVKYLKISGSISIEKNIKPTKIIEHRNFCEKLMSLY